jgi:hypothetical protein
MRTLIVILLLLEIDVPSTGLQLYLRECTMVRVLPVSTMRKCLDGSYSCITIQFSFIQNCQSSSTGASSGTVTSTFVLSVQLMTVSYP